jgi:mannosyl-glycoprotein endo-beta-N-acetylglucosaminidase
MRLPEAAPFHSLAELRDWVSEEDDVFACCQVPLMTDKKQDKQRVLVCHDMAGGYLPGDRFLQGSSCHPIYTLKAWDLVDVFVYFSHSRVAPPPSTWTAAAHRNGVKVLGTLITEDPTGAAENQELVFGPAGSSMVAFSPFYADKLVDLACKRGFDGWFLNLESPLPSEQITHLVTFLEYLTRRMHAAKPGSLVLWYDSVTTAGAVDWQDALTPLNKVRISFPSMSPRLIKW